MTISVIYQGSGMVFDTPPGGATVRDVIRYPRLDDCLGFDWRSVAGYLHGKPVDENQLLSDGDQLVLHSTDVCKN